MNTGLRSRGIVAAWNRTTRGYPSLCVHQLIADQVGRTPEAIAIRHGHEAWSYRELSARAESLAARLRDAGVQPETLVGVCLERSAALIVTLTAVMQAGAAYVPLDPAYPRERLRETIADAGITIVVSDARCRSAIDAAPVRIVDLDERSALDSATTGSRGPLVSPVHLEQLAYVIYTSGSTGTPKGVAVTHRGLTNYVCWCLEAYDVAGGSGAMLHTPLGFDLTVTSIFPVLAAGRCIWIGRPADDAETTVDALRGADDLSLFKATPSHLQVLSRQLTRDEIRGKARVLILGGEALLGAALRFWREAAPGTRVINEYGPTETVVGCCTYEIDGDPGTGPVPIGRPIANTQVYVLERGIDLSARGAVGELCIGGAGLARGYWRRPSLTAERFVPHPYATTPGERLYRTGDLVRWRPDDQLEYVGRRDDQVKIRGHRVELGELERVLRDHPAVEDAAALARARADGVVQLLAFAVSRDTALTSTSLKAFLRERLPEYMIPSAIALLDALPLTMHGKVDRAALATHAADTPADRAAGAGDRGPLEELLAGIVADVLDREDVDIHESFFDLGGDSLLAVQAAWRASEAFATEVPLQMLMEAPTVASLAQAIELQIGRGLAPPVSTVPRGQPLPLSYAQQRLWFLDRAAPDSSAYHVPLAIRLRGTLDEAALRDALDLIVARHEVLRTRLVTVEGEPKQDIADRLDVPIEVADTTEAEMPGLIANECRCGFDLTSAPLFRVTLLRIDPRHHVLLIVLHHIVTDGWSTGILLGEFVELYRARISGRAAQLPDLPIQYADHAVWQRDWLDRGERERQLTYWRTKLAGPPVLNLPWDRPRPASAALTGATIGRRMTPEVSGALRRLCRAEGATLFMGLLAGLSALLARYGGHTDLVIGSAAAGRGRPETAGLVGFFVNLLGMRIDLSGRPSFRELLRRVRQTALEAYAHQDVPFEQVVEDLQPARDLTRQPLFDVLFSMQHLPRTTHDLAGLRIERATTAAVMAKFDVTIAAVEDGDSIALRLEYATELFDRETIERLAAHWEQLLGTALAAPDLPLAQLEFLEPAERAALVTGWNSTTRAYPPLPLHALVADHAARMPHSEAVVWGSRRLRYDELDRRATLVAARLRAIGAGPDRVVAIFCERSLELVIALLGVLKSGAAYLPLGTNEPAPRLALMLADAQPIATLVQPALADRLPPGGGVRLTLGGEWDVNEREAGESPAAADVTAFVSPDNLAYIIYTSGSTGAPKGVAITHRGLTNYVQWCLDAYDIAGGGGTALHTTLSVDLTVTSILPALAAGRSVWIGPPEDDASATLAAVRARRQLSLLKLTPSHLVWMRDQLDPGIMADAARALVIGGEALHTDTLARWRTASPAIRIINEYGPTEAVVGCITYEVPADAPAGPVPIGLPIANMAAFVLDREMQLCPIGATGELYLAGIALARGYVGRPGLTAERFLPHPFATTPGERVYRTGDVARRRRDGVLEYLGRRDAQVKVRGHRVELAEIEAALCAHPDVSQAAVLAQDDGPAGARLIAYVAPAANATIDLLALRQQIKEQLPDQMVPAGFARLDALPMTAGGKIDRLALAALDAPIWNAGGLEYRAPRTPIEGVLAGIWADALRRDRVGIHDDFFQLGGHSLLAATIAWRASTALSIDVPLQRLLQFPTIAGLAAALERTSPHGGAAWTPLVPAARGGDQPLSYAQQRLWFLDQLEPGSSAYNVPIAIRIHGPLDEGVLRHCFDAIVARHEVLRTGFVSVGGQPVQRIREHSAIDLRVEAPLAEHRAERVAAVIAEECARPFDLASPPLLRVTLVRLSPEEHVLVLVLHHIVCDGWSMDVLAREFAELYRAGTAGEPADLPALPVQYADYAAWQRAWMEDGELDRQLAYWSRTLASPPPRLQLGLEPARDPLARGGGSLSHTWPSGLVQTLHRLGRQESCTLNMLLVAGLSVLLHAYSRQEDLIIGIDVAGRRRAETEPLIGFFVNQLALRIDARPDRSFRAMLQQIRTVTISAYAHQDVPFDRLVAALGAQARDGRQSLFNVKLTMRNVTGPQESGEPSYRIDPLRLDVLATDDLMPKFDLLFEVLPRRDDLVVRAQFDRERFAPLPIEVMLDLYRTALALAADAPEIAIGDLVQQLAAAKRALFEDAHTRIKQSWATGRIKRRALAVPGSSSKPAA